MSLVTSEITVTTRRLPAPVDSFGTRRTRSGASSLDRDLRRGNHRADALLRTFLSPLRLLWLQILSEPRECNAGYCDGYMYWCLSSNQVYLHELRRTDTQGLKAWPYE
jgi:hypothetical protein